MSKKKLTFESIDIRKMPGLKDGLDLFEDLSPNINIIAGPNASGKSSAAKAIQQLIWPGEASRIEASGRLRIDDDQWVVSVDHSFTDTQKNGVPSELQVSMAPDFKSRYVLSLHDLIRGDESDLAHQIQKDAIGGYDIDSAADKLGYKKPTNRRVKENDTFEKAKKRVKDIIGKQEALQSKKLGLRDLKDKQEDAKKAKSRSELYSEVIELRKAEGDLRHLNEQLETFPDGMDQVWNGDDENVEELQKAKESAKGNLEESRTRLQGATDQLQNLNLPNNEVKTDDLRLAQNLVSELVDEEKEIHSIRESIKEEQAKKDEIARTLSLNANQTEELGFNPNDIKLTEQFWLKMFEISGKKRTLQNEVAYLNEESESYENSETIVKGIDALSKWLQTYSAPEKTPILMLVLILIASVATAGAVQLFGPIGYAGVLFIGILLILLYNNSGKIGNAKLDAYIDLYADTHLIKPTTWNADDVSHRLQELTDDLKSSKWQEKLEETLHLKQLALNDVEEDLNAIEKEATALKEKLGAIPGIDQKSLKNYASLYWYCTHLNLWQENKAHIAGLNAGQEEKQILVNDLYKKINSIFDAYNLDSVHSHIDAKVRTNELTDLKNTAEDLNREMSELKKAIKQNEDNISEANSKLGEIFNRLGIENENLEEVKDLVSKIDAYEGLKANIGAKQQLVRERHGRVENHPVYDSEQEKTESMEIAEIIAQIEELESQYDKLDEHTETITKIEDRIEVYKSEHNLEQALADKQESLQELEDIYQTKVTSATGDLLVSQLKKQLGDKNMPDVFQRAKELFLRITKNRYELKVIGTDSPRFSAIDTIDGLGRSLNELSTGTRIQLLMSVRLAFLEKSEGDIMLPILADELLANSDSNRAAAIIDALTEISKEGRQIFYFTAQEDEIYKWKDHLKEDKETLLHVHILNKNGRSLQTKDETRLTPEIRIFKEIPEPGGLSHEEYGKLIDLPKINLLLDSVGSLHIWYLVEEPELLYHILKAGPERWGMLKHFMDEEGVIEGLDDQVKEEISNKAMLFEKYVELYRQGRPKPIDRSVLEDSGATRVDEVSDVMQKVDYNPKKLIKALRNSEIKGYYNSVIDRIEEYFVEHGYLDNREPMDESSLQVDLQVFVSNLNLTSEEAENFLKRINES